MRSIEWLYEQLGKLHVENLVLKEELSKLQVQNASSIPARTNVSDSNTSNTDLNPDTAA